MSEHAMQSARGSIWALRFFEQAYLLRLGGTLLF